MNEQSPRMLRTKNYPIVVNGTLWYNNQSRVNNMISLKRKVLEEFPSLKEKGKHCAYQMEICKDFAELRSRITEIETSKQGVPVLLFFYELDENENV